MAVILASILASIVVALQLSKIISMLCGPCRADEAAGAGDFWVLLFRKITGKDETQKLTHSTAELVAGLNTIINDIGYL